MSWKKFMPLVSKPNLPWETVRNRHRDRKSFVARNSCSKTSELGRTWVSEGGCHENAVSICRAFKRRAGTPWNDPDGGNRCSGLVCHYFQQHLWRRGVPCCAVRVWKLWFWLPFWRCWYQFHWYSRKGHCNERACWWNTRCLRVTTVDMQSMNFSHKIQWREASFGGRRSLRRDKG